MTTEHSPTRLASLFPAGVVTVEANPATIAGTLHAAERASIDHAARKRQREFTAGRLCARRALGELGLPDQPLLAGEDRTPSWPEGIIGSISHCRRYCGVAVARRGALVAIGLDVEPEDGFAAGIWDSVLTADERRWVERHPVGRRESLAKLLFSAKECTYKCQYAVGKTWLGFHDVELRVDLERGTYSARLIRRPAARLAVGAILHGHFGFDDGLILTGMVLRSDELPPPGTPAV